MKGGWWLGLMAVVVACSDGGGQGPTGGSGGAADGAVEAADGALAEVDAAGGDGGGDADAGAGEVDGGVADGDALDAAAEADAGGACGVPAPLHDPYDPGQTKFALSLYHYNVQYVVGGLEYVDDKGVVNYMVDQPEAHGWAEARVEDWIITETYVPILALYDKHPDWRVTLEMQAYMVEVMAERHPEALALTRKLAERGQAELVSFHYADQLFLAFPREDLQRSIDRTKAIFAAHCLPLSGVVFNQEGQAGEGRQRMLVENGYEIGVFPKNLWRYVRGEGAWWPYYASEGGTLVVGPGGVDPASGVEVAWDFFDDGELRSVPDGVNPYLAPFFVQSAERVAELEAALEAREAAGFKLTSITDYVRQLEARGVEKKAAPPLLDGTWQPPSTDSIHRWMGGRSQVFVGADEDNAVRAGNASARTQAAVLQVLAEHLEAEGLAPAELAEELEEVWTRVFHSQVSDCSGVNPWRGEVLTCLRHNADIGAAHAELGAEAKALLGAPFLQVDTLTREVTVLDDLPMPEPPAPAEPQLAVAVEAPGRQAVAEWFELGPDRWQVLVQVAPAPAEPPCEACDTRYVKVAWPRTEDVIRYSPGLIEDEVRSYALSDFTFLEGQAWLPLANGLIGLGDDWWVIKLNTTCHIAARVAPGTPAVEFIDATVPEAAGPTWGFVVFHGGEADALDLANRLNIHPTVFF